MAGPAAPATQLPVSTSEVVPFQRHFQYHGQMSHGLTLSGYDDEHATRRLKKRKSTRQSFDTRLKAQKARC